MTVPTSIENTKVFPTYVGGEAYMNRLAKAFPEKIENLDLEHLWQWLPIRAIKIDDPSKPAFYLVAARQGLEPMGRECALKNMQRLN